MRAFEISNTAERDDTIVKLTNMRTERRQQRRAIATCNVYVCHCLIHDHTTRITGYNWGYLNAPPCRRVVLNERNSMHMVCVEKSEGSGIEQHEYGKRSTTTTTVTVTPTSTTAAVVNSISRIHQHSYTSRGELRRMLASPNQHLLLNVLKSPVQRTHTHTNNTDMYA